MTSARPSTSPWSRRAGARGDPDRLGTWASWRGRPASSSTRRARPARASSLPRDLDEYAIAALAAEPVDSYGVGTSVVTVGGADLSDGLQARPARERIRRAGERRQEEQGQGVEGWPQVGPASPRSQGGLAEAEVIGIGERPATTAMTASSWLSWLRRACIDHQDIHEGSAAQGAGVGAGGPQLVARRGRHPHRLRGRDSCPQLTPDARTHHHRRPERLLRGRFARRWRWRRCGASDLGVREGARHLRPRRRHPPTGTSTRATTSRRIRTTSTPGRSIAVAGERERRSTRTSLALDDRGRLRKGEYSAAYSGFECHGIDAERWTLADWLAERGVSHVDVVGIATDHCVRATALDARREGWTRRCCSTSRPGSHGTRPRPRSRSSRTPASAAGCARRPEMRRFSGRVPPCR